MSVVTPTGGELLDDHALALGAKVNIVLTDVRSNLDVLVGTIDGATAGVLVILGRDDVVARVRWDRIAYVADAPTDHPGLS